MNLKHVHHRTFDKLICAISIICLAVVLVVVLVLKDSLRTYFKSLSLSWSLGVRSLPLPLYLWVRSRRSLSLSWSLRVRSLSLSWSVGVRSLSLSWYLGVRSLLTSLDSILVYNKPIRTLCCVAFYRACSSFFLCSVQLVSVLIIVCLNL